MKSKTIYNVYCITNTVNGMQYIGMTRKSITRRFIGHSSPSSTSRISKAIRSHGRDKFTLELLSSHEELVDAMIVELQEMKARNTIYPNGYNNLYTVDSCNKISRSNKGRELSDSTKNKIKEARAKQEFLPEVIDRRNESIRETLCKQITDGTNIYESVIEASNSTGIPVPSISRVLTGYTKNPKHGIMFSYVEKEVCH